MQHQSSQLVDIHQFNQLFKNKNELYITQASDTALGAREKMEDTFVYIEDLGEACGKDFSSTKPNTFFAVS